MGKAKIILFSIMTLININLWAQTAPGPMIEISANIYEYRLDTEKQLGIFYEFNANEDTSLQNSNVYLHGTENVFDDPIRALDISGSFAEIAYGSIDFNLKTALTEGRATIISNPNILVANGQEATLISGEEVPLTVLEVKGNNTKLTTQTRSTGIKLIVTPQIFSRNKVMMNIEIESSEITRFDVFEREGESRFELPVVTKRNIRTVVILPSEQQLYIGGLYTNNTGDLTRKIPIAGDIPGLGFFLRGFNKTKNQTETVFQITPTIRRPGDGIETEDTIFQELLRTEDLASQEILQPEEYKEEADQESQLDTVIPPMNQDRILNATEAANINEPKIIEPLDEERINVPQPPAPPQTQEEELKKVDQAEQEDIEESEEEPERIKTKDIFQRPERYRR